MKHISLLFSAAVLLLGQYSYAQNFTKSNGPNGGTVTAISTTTSGTIIAGTNNAGAFRSENNGQTWTRISSGLTDSSITATAISSGSVFIGTASQGLLRSENNGETFVSAMAGITNSTITSISTSGNTIYVGTRGGVFKSVDNGITFTQMSTGLPTSATTSVVVNAEGNVVVGTEDGKVFQFSSTLNAFVDLNSLIDGSSVKVLTVDSSGNIYASSGNGFLYRMAADLPIWYPVEFGITPGTTVYNSVAVASNGKIYIATNGSGIFRSDDNGLTFNGFSAGLTDSTILSVAVGASSQVYIGTKTDGIFSSSNDGSTYTRIGIPALTISKIATVQNTTTAYAATTISGLFISKDNGQTWQDLNLDIADSSITSIAVSSQGQAVVSTRGSGIFITRDNGAKFIRLDTATNLSNVTSAGITLTGDVLVGTEAGLFRMQNNAKTFVQVTSGIANSAVQSINVAANGGIIVKTATSLFISADGNTFTEVPNSGSLTGVIDIAATSQANVNVIAAATVNGVFRSVNSTSYELITAGLEAVTVTSVAVDAAGNVLVGTTNGAYSLMAGATSFTQIAGTANLDVTAIAVSKTTITGFVSKSADLPQSLLAGTTDILIGTRKNSVYNGTIQFENTVSVDELPVSVASLGINTPNPAHETMTIPFSLQSENHVVLKIYDAMGMERQTILNGTIGAGAQTAAVNVSNLPVGTYFYRLMIGNSASQRSFVVVR